MRDDAMKDHDDLDILLDAALATYSDVESFPGLEARILASTTRLHNRRRSPRWLTWAVPSLAVALLITIFLIHRPTVSRAPSQPAGDLAASRGPAPAPPAAPAHTAVEATPHLRSPHPPAARLIPAAAPIQSPQPKQEVFPTPMPLSPEEQALAALVNRDPDRIAQQITQSAAQPQPIEPLRIAAIHIPPLNPPGNGGN